MHDLKPAPSSLLKVFAFIARWTLALLLFAWFIAVAGWGVLHLVIVPRIGEFRPFLEVAASRTLGVTVRVGGVSAYSSGMMPAFELSDVRLLDGQGRENLRLPQVLVAVSPKSLISMRLEQLYVANPTLSIRRDAQGLIHVAGFEVGSGQADNALLDSIFSQPEFALRGGSILWTDELRGLPPLALREVNMVLRNTGRRHEFRVDATPPVDWGDRFGLQARFEQPFLSRGNGRWQEWAGQVFADFPRIDVSHLKRHADVGVDVRQGHGALRAWVDVRRERVTAATLDVLLADLVVGLDAGLSPLSLARISGRLSAGFAPGTVEFATHELAFDTAEGAHWPGGNVRFLQAQGDASRPARGELDADRLDLAALTQIANRLPLGAPAHAALARHEPAGLVQTLKARWQGTPHAPTTYEVQGKVQDLRLRAHAAAIDANKPVAVGAAHPPVGTPGVAGLALDFALNNQGGKATARIQEGYLEFPGVFDEARIPVAQFTSTVNWQLDPAKGGVRIDLPDMRFRNADADGEARLRWQTSDPASSASRARLPGVLDLQGTLSRADGTRVHRYLPLSIPRRARDYVREAVTAGVASGVKFKVKGDLNDLPSADPRKGEFRISANLRNVAYAYVPRTHQPAGALPWPALADLSGELVFEGLGMRVVGARGAVVGTRGVQVTRANAAIDDLNVPRVMVNAEARGPLADMLTVVNGSPLFELTEHALAGASAAGNAELRLKLGIPTDHVERSTVQGSVAMAGNDIQLAPDIPRLTRVRGTMNFSETGFSASGIQARVLGGDVRIDGGSSSVAAAVPALAAGASAAARPVGVSAQFRMQGSASMEALRQARELGFAARLAQYASGSASYVATLGLRAGVPEFSLTSNLAGLAINLPAPLGKTAEAALPLRVETTSIQEPPASGATVAQRAQDRITLELGRVAQASFVRDLSTPVARVQRGAIGVGLAPDEGVVMPAEGVAANIQLQTLDLDAWREVMAKIGGSDPTPARATPPPGPDAAQAYLPTSVALRADTLTAGGRSLHKLVAGGRREGRVWQASVDTDELAGFVEYRQSSNAGAGLVFARLSRMSLASSSARDMENLLNEPSAIPALDVVVEDMELRGKDLGRVEITAINRLLSPERESGAREWRLTRFDITTPEATFRATGNWVALNAQLPARSPDMGKAPMRRTVMNFRLDINDSGLLLQRFGMPGVVRRGKGNMEGQIAWLGSPLGLDYPSLGGNFHIMIESGQFLKADPGLTKLLGVLNLQTLPRRLTLDFRDVFSEGFDFDFFRGDIKIEHGIASTNNLQMKGVNAAVLMDGSADLARETQDLSVVVVPEINAGTASLIATAINPAIGLGSFLAQWLLRRPLMQAATQEFHIDGTWTDPRITRVPHRPSAPATTTAQEESAASAGTAR